MTQEEIISQRQMYLRKIRRLQGEIEKVRVDIGMLQDECPHPKKFTRHHYDGSTSEFCPDCERSDG